MTASLWCRTDPELVEGLDDAVHSLFAREVDLLRLIAELSGRGSDVGNPAQVASMAADRTTMSLYLARNLVTFAQRLRDRPRVFEAYAGERISKPSATLIMDFLDDPPPNMPTDEVATAESVLIEFASSHKQAELSATIDGIREHYTEPPCDSESGSAGDGASEGDDHGAGSSGKDGTGGDSGAEGEGRAAGGKATPWPLRRRSDTFGCDDTTRNTLFHSRTLGGRYVVRGDLDAETGERLSAVLCRRIPHRAPRRTARAIAAAPPSVGPTGSPSSCTGTPRAPPPTGRDHPAGNPRAAAPEQRQAVRITRAAPMTSAAEPAPARRCRCTSDCATSRTPAPTMPCARD
ncbi:DUF222 domain-containing protein [Tomitella gaofuii]|uniref:DUF222 domain-containing protein n=1 Tax=Tomitella gaofuii TaxID=2760083 RepID=UPI0015F81331|nr:DUF222 domain-containing protein [Tomitella gaofuii]